MNDLKPKKKKKKINDESIVDQIKRVSKSGIKEELDPAVPTGVTLIDLLASNTMDGIPVGMINIVGDSGTGKSFIAGEILAAIYYHFDSNIDWHYDNIEMGYKIDSKSLYDFDILKDGFFKPKKNEIDINSDTIQDFECKIDEVIAKKDPAKPFVYIIDSFDALTSDDEINFMKKQRSNQKKRKENNDNDEKEKGTYNLQKQKFMKQFCRTYIKKIIKNNIWLIIVSQVAENIGVMFGAKYKRLGGKALDFYPNLVIWLAEAEKYKKKGLTIGICVKIKSTKSRSKTPYRWCYVDLILDYGIDNISSNIKYLYDLKTEKGKDKNKINKIKIEWDGKEFIIENLMEHIEINNLENELANRVIKKWEDIEKSISSKDRKSKWN